MIILSSENQVRELFLKSWFQEEEIQIGDCDCEEIEVGIDDCEIIEVGIQKEKKNWTYSKEKKNFVR